MGARTPAAVGRARSRPCSSAVDVVFTRHERLWQESKQEAIQALSAGFADKMARVTHELQARDATVHSISRYFEQLVADLTDKSTSRPEDAPDELPALHRAARIVPGPRAARTLVCGRAGRYHRLQVVQRRTRACRRRPHHRARRANLLREQVRSDDLLAQERPGAEPRELHARLGGDEFCFLIPDLAEYHQAYAVAERFREAVERYDWTTEDARLAVQPVRVDVGVVCLRLGPGRGTSLRGAPARRPARSARRQADVRSEGRPRQSHLPYVRTRVLEGELVDVAGGRPRTRATSRLSEADRLRRTGCLRGRAVLPSRSPHGGYSSMVRAPVCGTGGCGFNPRYPPHFALLIHAPSLNVVCLASGLPCSTFVHVMTPPFGA